MDTLEVALGDRSYPIYIGAGCLDQADLVQRHVVGQQVMIVSNDTIAPLYLEKAKALFAGYDVSWVILPDGEKYKDLDHLNLIFDALLKNRHSRSTTLVALGGGVVGDMTGYAAASYQRGVNFIQLPTTLLAQVDSSVGGKTGVNHQLGKNMIGAFHQPQCVIIDPNCLQTLSGRQLSSGLAEVIKYGLIWDEAFFSWLESEIENFAKLDMAVIERAIYRSCEIKAEVVAQDERESGVRALLNLGHTFGHAIENCAGYGEVLHGEAVAIGTYMAADLSKQLGWLTAADCVRIEQLTQRAGLPLIAPPELSATALRDAMNLDKKVENGNVRLVLMTAIGKACVTQGFERNQLEQTLAAGESLCK